MRRIPVPAALLISAAVFLAPPASAGPESCATLGGVTQGETCRVQATTPEYTIDMTFPLNYPDEQAILDYLAQTRDGFVNIGQTPDFRNIPHELAVTAESLASAQTRSVVLSLFQEIPPLQL